MLDATMTVERIDVQSPSEAWITFETTARADVWTRNARLASFYAQRPLHLSRDGGLPGELNPL